MKELEDLIEVLLPLLRERERAGRVYMDALHGPAVWSAQDEISRIEKRIREIIRVFVAAEEGAAK